MEIEKFFSCPFCREKISFILEVSENGTQTYVEDCEVCCRAIQVTYEVHGEQIRHFSAGKAYE